ncbi:LIC_12337 family protein [Leptospira licerasiae]|uniref:DUF3344 domain-containing protein n=1 Tax=Leptospira licerasiae str. MMD4847 TaxID=1049971 RepID=A0ABN0HCX1_9LEPT|nr:hypothetical protein [Leptospira licerasiae]EIE00869.1 hypothetical protein LEP1GSC185_0111 [Leptospira licerasiae serovar Varillal str. VAR 010]EJZ43427.1 hypothetical protein LEP1GSC178_2470 [Leptospira licerasiae str. MMD4847]
MKLQNRRSILPKVVLALLVFFGITAGFKFNPGFKKEKNNIPFSLNVSLLRPLHASADQWGFVRGSATWARGNSLFMDDVIGSIQANPGLVFLASQANGITQDGFSTTSGTNFTISLKLNGTFTASSTAYTGTKTFSNYLELKNVGTTDPANIALQFYWDDNPRDSLQDGALVRYRLQMLNPSQDGGSSADIESYVYSPDVTDPFYSTNYPNQGLVQVYSWDDKLANDNEISLHARHGRVILEEMDDRTVFCFKAIVRVDATANLIPASNANAGLCSGSASDEYYKLAYSQKLTGDLEVTAKSGWEEGAITSGDGTLCGLISLNYGLFNVNGFVKDFVDSGAIPASYVPATRVDGLYGRIGLSGKSGNTGDNNGVYWDDTRKSTIDALDIVFESSPPPFN